MISVDSLIFLSLTFSLGMLVLIRVHYYTPTLVEETASLLSVPTQENKKVLPLLPERGSIPATDPEVIVDSFIEEPLIKEEESSGEDVSREKNDAEVATATLEESVVSVVEEEIKSTLLGEKEVDIVEVLNGYQESSLAGNEGEAEWEENVIEEDEPLYEDGKGNKLFVSDLKKDWVNYDQLGKKEMSEEAIKYHTRGRKLSKLGAYGDAMKLLKKAVSLAESSPYPYYDLAMVYVMRGDSSKALTNFKQCDELAPNGFFEVKTAVAALEMEKAGNIPEGTFRLYLQIEDTQDRKKKIELARQLTERYPNFAPGWRAMANLLQDSTQRKGAIEEGLNALPDIDTYANLKINEALILDMDGNKGESIRILGQLIFNEANTLGAVGIAKFVLSSILNV